MPSVYRHRKGVLRGEGTVHTAHSVSGIRLELSESILLNQSPVLFTPTTKKQCVRAKGPALGSCSYF